VGQEIDSLLVLIIISTKAPEFEEYVPLVLSLMFGVVL
jgi:hypothetical protein